MANHTNFSGPNNFGLQLGQNYGSVHYSSNNPDEATKLKDAVEKLFITDAEVDREKVKSAKGQRVPGTCEWIDKCATYTNWSERKIPFLWIRGGPGKGKTMLSVYVTEQLEQRSRGVDENALYFFCDHRVDTRNTSTAILRGILFQLLKSQPVLQSHIATRTDSMNSLITSCDALWLLFIGILHDPARHPTKCVIDGVDECDEECVFCFFEHMRNPFTDETYIQSPFFQFLVVSRTSVQLDFLPAIDLDSSTNNALALYIVRFIDYRLERVSKLKGFTPPFRMRIREELVFRCESSFLWSNFVVQSLLRKKTVSDIELELMMFPRGLGPLYDRLLLQIEPQHRAQCATILQWAAWAIDPITLPELAVVLGLQASPTILIGQATRDQVTWSEPLVRLEDVGSENTKIRVFPVHQSLSTHLHTLVTSNEADFRLFAIDTDRVRVQMAQACLDYLNADFSKKYFWKCKDAVEEQKYPFMANATKN
ncbi:hypothetical protein CC86DRAFT_423166 [Ophiobolus disseminans]|uniref:Uncharacterized protein n=1 Tax=Ophiobolus disseminans TaxID=1469910 RepID=A0A6A6ZQI3_9PLEO|nr:hypothetical protein CC86DRAFT_423166 [Ophiobolus disseminans]